jgi:hypothetical protein
MTARPFQSLFTITARGEAKGLQFTTLEAVPQEASAVACILKVLMKELISCNLVWLEGLSESKCPGVLSADVGAT